MKTLFLFLPFLIGCSNMGNSHAANKDTKPTTQSHPAVNAAELFKQSDAVEILGEPAHMVDSSLSGDKHIARFNSGYKADSRAPNGDTGAIYFLYEEYDIADSAHSRYAFVLEANRKNGIRELSNLGDEAYYHTDSTHFRFIMARKNNRIIIMKINKITPHTSDEAFSKIAEKIVAAI